MYKRIVLFIFFAFTLSFAQDQIPGSKQINVPENIQSIKNAIRDAENNEDWNLYEQLRTQLINAWQQVNPEIAKLYGNTSNGIPDLYPDGVPGTHPKKDINAPTESILFENPNIQLNSLWGDDVQVTSGRANDISMDISRDGDIYLAVSGRMDGTATDDSLYIYKSTDGGLNWEVWSFIYLTTETFRQVEIMCLDGFPGSTGDSYLLAFFLFDDGWLRVGRTETSSPSWSYYTIAGELDSGYPTDFAVDRNYPGSDYRAICVYDSSNNTIKSIRSEPTSNGTVWQDAAYVGAGTLGRGDLDICYGLNGGVYVTFNGFNSGNLYAIENTNSADPSSWGSLQTIVTGSTDTTRHPEIISTRESIPSNTVVVAFELQSGSTYDLYTCTKASGESTFGPMVGWVIPDENKWPSMYSRKVNNNQVFESVFEKSGEGNAIPRVIRYKSYDGSIWSQSLQVSDAANDVTGLQKPEVGDIDGSTPVFAYVGGNYMGVYFDNYSWTPVSVENEIIPTNFSLEQNYPNPFNPSTLIKFSIPENSLVTIKVYDIIGNEVATLVSGEIESGNHQVTFDAKNLSSGIYLYKMQAVPENGEKAFLVTKKMMLIK